MEADGKTLTRAADVFAVSPLGPRKPQALLGKIGGKHLNHVAVADQESWKIEKENTFNQDVPRESENPCRKRQCPDQGIVQESGDSKILGADEQPSDRSAPKLTAELNVGQRQRKAPRNGSSMNFAHPDRTSALSAQRGVSTRIAVKAQGKILFIDIAEIAAIEARGNYVILHDKYGRHPLRQSISTIARKLEDFGFVRIHRSLIVNSLFAREIEALSSGDYLLRVQGGAQYTVTRTYKSNLRLLAGLWLAPQLSV